MKRTTKGAKKGAKQGAKQRAKKGAKSRLAHGVRPGQSKPRKARAELEKVLKERRAKYPTVLRLSLIAGAVCAGAMLVILIGAMLLDWHAFKVMLGLIFFTTFSGGQAAAFYAYRATPPLSIFWVTVLEVLNMAATLFVIIPLCWRGMERLRETRLFGELIMSAEHVAAKRRRFLSRWGLLALSIITAAPVQGAGVLGAGVLGVLLRVPVRRLLATLLIVGTAVNVFWAVFIGLTAQAIPTGGVYDLLPWLVIGAIVVAGVIAAVRGRRRERQVLIDTFGWLTPEQRGKLGELGIRGTAELMRVDLRKLSRRLGIPDASLGRARNVAALLRLESIAPEDAVRLTEAGVARIRDLAVAPPDLVQRALAETPGPPVQRGQVKRWHREAVAFVAETKARREGNEPASVPPVKP